MTWVRTVGEDEAEGFVKQAYEADLDTLGFVLEATKALSASPDLLRAYMAFKTAVKATPGLTQREQRLIHLLVADRIHSTPCLLLFGAALERDLGGPEGLRAVLRDHHQAELSEREVAILDYALAVALGHAREEHVARLRQLGLDDAAILQVAFNAALRLLGSRVYGALGVEADPFFLEQTDLVEALIPGATREQRVIEQSGR
jgi:uncharacterized peroxidase-related enzyme